MTKVGERPLQSVLGPSFCAIFRSPSHVLLIVLRSTSSTAHPISAGLSGDMVGPATQKGALLFIQKTSLQHADMPMFGGRSRNCVRVPPLKTRGCDREEEAGTVSCDCRRTRTTSRGVTVGVSIWCHCAATTWYCGNATERTGRMKYPFARG
jgi:hypothetical protein